MIMSNVLSGFILVIVLSYCEMHKILVVSHLPIKSHAILNHVLVKLLLDAGNEITQITLMPINRTHPNLRQIDASYNEKYFRDNSQRYYSDKSMKIFSFTMQHDDVTALLSDTSQKFDLVIAEWMYNDLCIGLAALYDCPLIWFSALETIWAILQGIEEISSQAFTTSVPAKSDQMFSAVSMMKEAHLDSLDKKAFIEIFEPLMALRGKPLPSYTDLLYLSSMVFVYSPVLLGDDSKWPQNFKPVGGYHMGQKLKPLSKDLKSIMDNARHGVIYLSFGSLLYSRDIPDVIQKKLVEMFSRLKQIVLWKHESKVPNLPGNVHVMKWAQQQSILGHPNCVLFITHGGMLSVTEAAYYGVPIIGIPVFGDQSTNIRRAVENGYAKRIHLSPRIADDIRDAIVEMLRNSSYRQKVKDYSAVYHNRSMPPSVEVVHWVNHVIRKGIPHREVMTFYNIHSQIYIKITLLLVTIIVAIKYVVQRLQKYYTNKNKNVSRKH